MRSMPPILLACAFAIPSLAQDAKTNAVPGQAADTSKATQSALTFPVSAGAIKSPMVLTNGYISQPDQLDVADAGRAVYEFTITTPGNYLIHGVANAPDDSANSFYVNVDAQPDDLMIWDIEVTNGFEERIVNWRGSGDSGSGEFVPKRFNLSAGAHKLIIAGREPAQLKSISIRPAAN